MFSFLKRFLIIFISLFLLGSGYYFYHSRYYYSFSQFNVNLKKRLNFNISSSKRGDLLELTIPCIEFYSKIYDIDLQNNQLKYGVSLLKDSDISKNLYFFAAHSGYGRYSYFNDLVYLRKGDVVFVESFGKKKCYVVDRIYLIDKLGYMLISRNRDVLYLITCSLKDKNKQLVIEAYLTDE